MNISRIIDDPEAGIPVQESTSQQNLLHTIGALSWYAVANGFCV